MVSASLLVALLLPCLADAAGTLYFSHENQSSGGGGEVSSVPLGAAGPALSVLFTTPEATSPEGVALDPAAGKIYWIDKSAGEIMVAPLGGEAAGKPAPLFKVETESRGLTIDPVTGMLYWVNSSTNEILSGGIGGEAAGKPVTLLKEPAEAAPYDIVVDPATGTLYWTDRGSGDIRSAEIAGEHVAQATTLYEERGARPVGIALDAATGMLYWADEEGVNGEGRGEIRAGSIAGKAAPPASTVFKEATPENGTYGLALDPAEGELYWTAFSSGALIMGAVGGQESGATATTLLQTPERGPNFPALLDPPFGTGAPVVSGTAAIGSRLSCSQGNWAADMPEASYYQAPQSFAYQWTRDGAPISGATAASFTPSEGGSYVCDVRASNAAGSAAQGSAVTVVPAPAPTAAISAPASGGTHTAVPKPVSVSVVKIVSGKAIVKGGHARVRLACKGDARCAGKLVLKARVRVSVKHGRRHRRRMLTIVVGRASFSIRAGDHATVAVKLSAFARRALASARDHRVKANAIAKLKGGKKAHREVRLLEKLRRHAHRRKHKRSKRHRRG